jgi:hypothetical protein
LASCVFVPYIALIYLGISWSQLKKVDPRNPRLERAKTALRAYAVLAGVIFAMVMLGAIA